MVNIKNVDSNLMKIDKKSCKDYIIYLLHWIHQDLKNR